MKRTTSDLEYLDGHAKYQNTTNNSNPQDKYLFLL